MIRSFRHKGLWQLYRTGKTAGLNPQWVKRLRAILARLDASTRPQDVDHPGLRLHPLKGEWAGFWAVEVSGNWRVVFRFEDDTPGAVDLIDYH